MAELHMLKDRVDLLNYIKELENDIKVDKELMDELLQTRILQSEVHSDIEKVWMYDSSFPLNEVSMEERAKLIERVFYKVANQWI
jgi:hypothetical protein